jgi:hypothetical protein
MLSSSWPPLISALLVQSKIVRYDTICKTQPPRNKNSLSNNWLAEKPGMAAPAIVPLRVSLFPNVRPRLRGCVKSFFTQPVTTAHSFQKLVQQC